MSVLTKIDDKNQDKVKVEEEEKKSSSIDSLIITSDSEIDFVNK